MPVPFPLRGRRVLLVADEDVAKIEPGPPSFLWLVDITDERRPVPFASFQVEGVDGTPAARVHRLPSAHARRSRGRRSRSPGSPTGCASSTSPIRTRRARWRTTSPTCPRACSRVSSNDVFVDDRGLIYLIDRGRGLHILERV